MFIVKINRVVDGVNTKLLTGPFRNASEIVFQPDDVVEVIGYRGAIKASKSASETELNWTP